MALANFTDLSASIASWIHRGDLAATIPDFILLAEKRISAFLRARLQETAATIATTAGMPTASLPSTLLGIQSVTINAVTPTLDYLPPEQFNTEFPDTSYSGAPRCYTTVGDLVYFGPVPDAVYTVSVVYHSAITPLSAGAPTNALLTKWPNVYLAAAMVEATDFTKDVAANAKWEAKFQDAIAGVNLIDWHAGGLMRVRTDTGSY